MIIPFYKLQSLRKRKTVYTAGCFDLFHRGHIAYLKEIKKKWPHHKLVLGIAPDRRVSAKKGPGRPIIKQADRLAVVDAIKYVDYSFICPAHKGGVYPMFDILKKMKPDIVVSSIKRYRKLIDEFQKVGSKLIIQKRIPHDSTSIIIERIKRKMRVK